MPFPSPQTNNGRSDLAYLLIGTWLLIVAVGYAVVMAGDLTGQPLFSVDLLLPAYGVMLVGVIIKGMASRTQPTDSRNKGDADDGG
jgi:hypothetical protein